MLILFQFYLIKAEHITRMVRVNVQAFARRLLVIFKASCNIASDANRLAILIHAAAAHIHNIIQHFLPTHTKASIPSHKR